MVPTDHVNAGFVLLKSVTVSLFVFLKRKVPPFSAAKSHFSKPEFWGRKKKAPAVVRAGRFPVVFFCPLPVIPGWPLAGLTTHVAGLRAHARIGPETLLVPGDSFMGFVSTKQAIRLIAAPAARTGNHRSTLNTSPPAQGVAP